MNFLGSIGRWIAGAIVPMFAPPKSPVPLAWFLHLLLLAGACIGLYYAQMHFHLTKEIGKGPDALRPYWLVILFGLAYALAWATMWLSGLLAPRQTTAAYPDLDEAWDAIRSSLDKAGIGLADTPVLLVLGELPSGYDALFRALPQGLTVNGGSPSGSPLRAYANRDAIYLTLEGATLLGIQETGEILLSSAPDQSFSGGQVDISNGNYVFNVTEGYLIEGGKIGRPVKNATLIGNGPEALKYVTMVGNDLKLDEGVGVCGKEGQSIPVGVGIPTVRIDRMTVGGTA